MPAADALMLLLHACFIYGVNILNYERSPITRAGSFGKGRPANFIIQHVDGSPNKVRLETDSGKVMVVEHDRVRIVEPSDKDEDGQQMGSVFEIARVDDEHDHIIYRGKCVTSQDDELWLGSCSRGSSLMYIVREAPNDPGVSGSKNGKKEAAPAGRKGNSDDSKLPKLIKEYIAMEVAAEKDKPERNTSNDSNESDSSEDSSSAATAVSNPMQPSGYPIQQFQQPAMNMSPQPPANNNPYAYNNPNAGNGPYVYNSPNAYASPRQGKRRKRNQQALAEAALQQQLGNMNPATLAALQQQLRNMNPVVPVAAAPQPQGVPVMAAPQQQSMPAAAAQQPLASPGAPALNQQQLNMLLAQLAQQNNSRGASGPEPAARGNNVAEALKRQVDDEQVKNFLKGFVKRDKQRKKRKQNNRSDSDDAESDDEKENAHGKKGSPLGKMAAKGANALVNANPALNAAKGITSLFG